MNEQYFKLPSKTTFDPSFWFMLKLRLFGKKITERHGQITAVWYLYNGVLYMTRYDSAGAMHESEHE